MAGVGDTVGLLHVLKSLESQFISLAGPASNAGLAKGRALVGLPDPAITREAEYFQQMRSVLRGSAKYQNTVIGVSEIIRMFHQARLIDGPQGAAAQAEGTWQWLHDRLAMHGIDVSMPGENIQNRLSNDWLTLVRMSATAAPLDSILRGYRRSRLMDEDSARYWENELKFAFQRMGMSREEDRRVYTLPFGAFSTLDAERLAWMGRVGDAGRIALYEADGFVRTGDREDREWLNARLPDPETLYNWSRHLVWNDQLADKYKLDSAFDNSPQAQFWARAQGHGVITGTLPDQPPGSTDWVKYEMRSHTPIIGFREACELQYRLRPNFPDDRTSIVPGALPWTRENTEDMLRMAGYTEPLVNRLMGVSHQPLNIRIINHVLAESLLHPEIAQAVQAVVGEGVDWVTSAFLDHGYLPHIAKMAADAVRATAQDRYDEEKTHLQKHIRREQRDLVLRRYELGVVSDVDAGVALQNDWVTGPMARDLLLNIDEKIRTDFVHVATQEIKAAFLEGKLSVEQVGAQLTTLGVNRTRQTYYVQEWVWQKNDRQRMLSTSEIVQALKNGIIAPAVAMARLINLGWTAPDAMVELALVEHEITQAKARVENAEAAKIISKEEKAKREAEVLAKAKARAELAAAKAAAKLARQEEAAPLQALQAVAKYDAAALLDLDAYLSAQGKGDDNKMQAEIAKAKNAYATLLLTQLKLKGISPKVADETEPIEPIEIPPPEADSGGGKVGAKSASPPSTTATNGGGTGNPPVS